MSYRKSDTQRRKEIQVRDLQGNTHKLPPDYPIDKQDLEAFLHEIYGQAVFPGDPDYDAAAAEFNPAFPAHPQIIVFCICPSDVQACLRLAHKADLQTVARSGRHSMAGYSVCDGMVIDVSQMNSVYIDVAAKQAVVGAGIQFERFNANLQSYGLHVPGGGCPTVCVGGYMQGAGYGFTSRQFGMHSDNVLEFKMVLANGRIVVASPERNADLFWAVRGGTGNQFGVLIEVRYRLYELDKVWGVRIDWSTTTHPEEAARALETIQDAYIRSSEHNRLGFQTAIASDPDSNDDLHVVFAGMYSGTEQELDAALEPLTSIPGNVVRKKFTDHYPKVDENLLEGLPPLPGPVSALSQSCYIERDLTAAEWLEIIEHVQDKPNSMMMIDMEGYGGAIADYPVESSAFIHRDALVDFFCDVFWVDDKDRQKNSDWLQELMQFMQKFSNGHSFQNYPNREQTDWRWAYFGKYYNTLVWVKQKYDPDNFFHYQQSITPDPDGTHDKDYAPLLFDDPAIVYED